jgi:hypothetical protein
MSLYQRSSATRASGCPFQNSTSVLRAMTLMAVYIMFPSWEQASRRAAALVVAGPVIAEWRPVFPRGPSSSSGAALALNTAGIGRLAAKFP